MELFLAVFIFIAVVLLGRGGFSCSPAPGGTRDEESQDAAETTQWEAYGQADVDLVRRR